MVAVFDAPAPSEALFAPISVVFPLFGPLHQLYFVVEKPAGAASKYFPPALMPVAWLIVEDPT
jgi:hypothetical protein